MYKILIVEDDETIRNGIMAVRPDFDESRFALCNFCCLFLHNAIELGAVNAVN